MLSLTPAEALVAIRGLASNAAPHCVNIDSIDRIMAQVAEPASWVPVQERLPEADDQRWSENVLTLYSSGVITVQPFYNTNTEFHLRGWKGRFLDESIWNAEVTQVTHWMPLPAAPVTVEGAAHV